MQESTTEMTLLRRALAHWESELRTVGGPDDLLQLDASSPRLLDLGVAHPNGMAGFLAGRPTSLTTLFRSPDSLRTARDRARALSLTARRLEDVYGLPGVFLATGVFRFDDPVLGRVQAPIVLRPLAMVPRGAGADVDFDLHPAEAARLNPALLTLLAEQGIDVAGEELTGDDHGAVARQLIDRLGQAGRQLDGTIADKNLIGTFADAGPAMVAALRQLGEESLAGHRTVSALLRRPSGRDAGRPAAQDAPAGASGGLSWHVSEPVSQPATRGRGTLPERAALLDEAQLAVVQAALAGSDVRVEAAPGAGVTTTAAAAVEALSAAGRQVLVVAPGRDELTDLMAVLRTDPSATAAGIRAADRAHARLHEIDPAWRTSRMQVIDRLAELGAAPVHAGAARLDTETLRSLTADRTQALTLLTTAAAAEAFTAMAVESPWAGAAIGDAVAARESLGTVERLLEDDLPQAERQLAEVAAAVGLPVADSLTEWTAHVEVLTSVRGSLDLFLPRVYDEVAEEMVVACASSQWRASHGASMSMLDRRRWRREAAALVRPGVQVADLHTSLSRVRLEKDLWQKLRGAGQPRITPQLADALAAYERAATDVAELEPVLASTRAGGQLADLTIDELRSRLRDLATHGPDLRKLPERARAIEQLDAIGLTPLVTQLRETGPGETDVAQALEVAWLRGVLTELGGLPAAAPAVPAPRPLADLPAGVAEHLTMTTSMALGRLTGVGYDTVVLLDAHRVGLSEAVLAVGRSAQVVLFGDPAGGWPTGLELDPADGRVRTSLFSASAGLLSTWRLDHVHRQPAALAELTYSLAAGAAVRPGWAVASAAGGELGFVHVPGGTVSADESGESIPGQEVEAVVAQIAEHVRTRGEQSLAVFTASRAMATEVADALRRALRRSPELAEWLSSDTTEPLAVTDLRHAGDVSRDHVIIALGLAHDPFGRFSHRFGSLDTESGAALIGAGVGRARQRVTVVSSLWASDIDPEQVTTDGGKRALRLLTVASEATETIEPSGDSATCDDDGDGARPAQAVLQLLSRQLGSSVVHGVRHDREPDLAVRRRGEHLAVLWDGFAEAGLRRPLAEALTRFGWTVRRVSASEVAR